MIRVWNVLVSLQQPGLVGRMAFDLTILQRQVDNIKSAVENGRFGDALIGALNSGNGLMQERIFSNNKDIDGNSFGGYVGKKAERSTRQQAVTAVQKQRVKALAGLSLTTYQKKRVLAGRQIDHKDLEFTGALRKSIETQVEDERSAVLQFNNDDAALIAHGQEQQITNLRGGGKGTTKGTGAVKIFSLDTDEVKQVGEQGAILINQIINDGINNTANTR